MCCVSGRGHACTHNIINVKIYSCLIAIHVIVTVIMAVFYIYSGFQLTWNIQLGIKKKKKKKKKKTQKQTTPRPRLIDIKLKCKNQGWDSRDNLDACASTLGFFQVPWYMHLGWNGQLRCTCMYTLQNPMGFFEVPQCIWDGTDSLDMRACMCTL